MRSERVQLVLISLVACLLWAATFHRAGAQPCGTHGCSTSARQTLQMGNCANGHCQTSHAGQLPSGLTFAAARPVAGSLDHLRQYIPDASLAAEPRLWLYTDATMPRVYQFRGGFHFASYNIAMEDTADGARGDGNGGNANIEFPWKSPGGTHRTQGVATFKFVRLPEGRPIVWFPRPGIEGVGYSWRYPVGTLVGEVLLMRCQDGQTRPFEMRTRERLDRSWTVDVLRPFPTAEHLAKAIEWLRPSDTSATPLAHHVGRPVELTTRTLHDHHANQAFVATAQVDVLPAIDPKLQAELLEQFAFSSALGETWRGESCFAPSGAITPDDYDGTFLGTTDQSCAACHRDTNKPTDDFDRFRDWYGEVSGSDGILSFTPIHMESAADNGFPRQPVFVNAAGVVEPYDPARHVGYHPLEGQQ